MWEKFAYESQTFACIWDCGQTAHKSLTLTNQKEDYLVLGNIYLGCVAAFINDARGHSQINISFRFVCQLSFIAFLTEFENIKFNNPLLEENHS